MKNRFVQSIAFFCGIALFLISCSQLPQAEIDAANAAVDSAKTVGAAIYAHDDFVALQDSLNKVLATVEVQKSKTFKNYDAAKAGLDSVAQLAVIVKQHAESLKTAMKDECEKTLAAAKDIIESDKQQALDASKEKRMKAVLAEIENEIVNTETLVAEADSLLENEELPATLDKAKVAKEKASSIDLELSDAIATYKVKK